MAILKSKEIAKMNRKDINEKVKELKIELIKARIKGKGAAKSSLKEMKRTIAKLLTFRNKLPKQEINKNKGEKK